MFSKQLSGFYKYINVIYQFNIMIQAQSLNVFKNDDDTFDYTDVNPAIAGE